MNTKIKMTLLVSLVFIFVTGIWAVDIGTSVSMLEAAGINVRAENIFFIRNGNTQYHLGLLVTAFAFLMLVILYINELFDEKKVI